jgi:hypothetical protein
MTLYLDSSFYHKGAKATNISFGPMSNLAQSRGGNLMDSSWWTPAVGDPTTNTLPVYWSGNKGVGAGGADAIVSDTLADGSMGYVWKATQDNAGAHGGGWNPGTGTRGNWFNVDQGKTYMFVCYFKRVSGAAYSFWGSTAGLTCDINTTTPNGNPYFASIVALPVIGRWYVGVGWVFPYGSTGNSNTGSGFYDCTTGLLVLGGANYNWAPTDYIQTRAYQYYGSTGAVMHFASPQAYLCDGSEPNISDLLSMGALSGRNPITPTTVSTFIQNASIVDAQIGSLNADKIVAGSIRGRNVQAAAFVTKGTFLVGVPSAGAATVTVDNTADFDGSGTFIVIDNVNDRDIVAYTGKNSTQFTGCTTSGGNAILGSHNDGATVVPLLKNIVIDDATNELRFYGNRGDGTIEELGSIGIVPYVSDTTVALFGSTAASRFGVVGKTSNYAGVWGEATSGYGGRFLSDTNHACVNTVSASGGASSYPMQSIHYGAGAGVYSYSTTGYGIQTYGNATKAHFALQPLAGRPSSPADGDLAMCFLSGGSGNGTRTSNPRLVYYNASLASWRYVEDNNIFNT